MVPKREGEQVAGVGESNSGTQERENKLRVWERATVVPKREGDQATGERGSDRPTGTGCNVNCTAETSTFLHLNKESTNDYHCVMKIKVNISEVINTGINWKIAR